MHASQNPKIPKNKLQYLMDLDIHYSVNRISKIWICFSLQGESFSLNDCYEKNMGGRSG